MGHSPRHSSEGWNPGCTRSEGFSCAHERMNWPDAVVAAMMQIHSVDSKDRMRVFKWGKSLAVRLPDSVVKALKLKSGDDIEIMVTSAREFQIDRHKSRERALARLRQLRKPLPEGFSFRSG
jgi:antitoxin MazE